MTSFRTARFALILVLGAAACGSSKSETPDPGSGGAGGSVGSGGASGTPDGGVAPAALTFWSDIAPIFNAKCVKCHQTGSLGPFRLDDYEEVKKNAAKIAAQTKAGNMPPFFIVSDGTCGDFDDSEKLTAAELEKIQTWTAGDLAQGTPKMLTNPKPPSIEANNEYKTPELEPVPGGTAVAMYDEYRCFPIEAKLDKDVFLTGYEVLPGTPSIVHHVLAFLIDPAKTTMKGKTNAELMKALDESDPDRVGWPCFGLAGEGVEIDSVPVTWAPGQGPVKFPAKMGVAHKKSHQLVIQIHYNLSDAKLRGRKDTTRVRFSTADAVERRLIFLLADGLLETLGKPMPQVIPPGMASYKYSWKKTTAELGLGQLPFVDIVGVMPHMHERGRKLDLMLTGADGKSSCAGKVERWDFNWQKFYYFKGTLPRLTPGAQMQVTCDYDTSKDKEPVLPGWGTRNEMCLDTLMLALPPGI